VLNLVLSSVTFQGANYSIYGAGANGVTMTLAGGNGSKFSIVSAANNCQFGLGTRLHLGSQGNIAVASGTTLTLRSRISGVFGFSKLSPGTLRLSATNANTFTGTTFVENGTLELSNGLNSPTPTNLLAITGPLVISTNQNDAIVRLMRDDQIGDSTPVTVNEDGSLLLNGHDDTIGTLTMAGGTINTGAGTLQLNGNVEVLEADTPNVESYITGNLSLGILGRTFTCAKDSALTVNATISGGLFGQLGAGVTKNGPGVMSLGGANTYPGNTYVVDGDLVIHYPQALGTTNGYTSVGTNAALVLFPDESATNNPSIAGERLVLYGGSQVWPRHDCAWEGPVELAGGETKFVLVPDNSPDPVFTIRGVISGPGGLTKIGPGDLWMAGLDHNTYTGRTYVMEGKLGLSQGGFATTRVAVPGLLVVGRPGQSVTSGCVVESWKNETINSNRIVLNYLGTLNLKGVTQTVSNLVVNSGIVDTGPTGLLKLTGAIYSTNEFPKGEIRGRLDLGNSPRRIHVQDYRLAISAAISGGPNATLEVTGVPDAVLDLVSSNSYTGLTLVRSGSVAVHDAYALGPVTTGVIVTNQGRISLMGDYGIGTQDFTITKAFLHLASDLNDISYVPFSSAGTNVWKGPVWLGVTTKIRSTGRLTIDGPISGPGGVEIYEAGEVVFKGVSAANTYAGPTIVDGGVLTLAKSLGIFTSLAVPSETITIKTHYNDYLDWQYGRVRLAANHQVNPSVLIDLESDTVLECSDGATNSIARFSGQGDIEFRGGLLKAGFDNEHFQFNGRFQGGDPLAPSATCFEKHGLGVLTLYHQNTLTGAVDVVQGKLYLPGTLPNALAYVRSGAMLMGDGGVGSVRVDGGTLRPGSNSGAMEVRSCTGGIAGLHSPGTLSIYLYGATAQAGCDRLVVETIPDVENLRLNFVPGQFQIPLGEKFLVISNRSASQILGKLNHPTTGQDLVEGTKFFVGQQRFAISYVGGDGNDVVITRLADPVPVQISGIAPDPDGMFISASGEPGLQYRVEANTDLGNAGGWIQIGSATMNGSGFANFTDGDTKNYPMRFYRFIAP
jgi:autotransporter-associated beta strand protein